MELVLFLISNLFLNVILDPGISLSISADDLSKSKVPVADIALQGYDPLQFISNNLSLLNLVDLNQTGFIHFKTESMIVVEFSTTDAFDHKDWLG
jgi:hypothetical protein